MLGLPARISGQADEFDTAVRPILTQTCVQCHDAQTAAGGMSVAELTSAESLVQHRDVWETILRRLRAGDMPPAGIPRPDAGAAGAMTGYIERAFERADAVDETRSGRMTAHRLNRNEYTNTIRDLLGVRFRADRDFPADDSGDGFDNIGDVLTVSPLLMERYLSAAERIARWAISTEIPAKPLEIGYLARESRIRRARSQHHRSRTPCRVRRRVHRPLRSAGRASAGEGLDAAPVKLGFWMDGALLATQVVETKPSGLVYFNPYSEEEFRLFLPEGDHVFRAGFIDDGFVKILTERDAYTRQVTSSSNRSSSSDRLRRRRKRTAGKRSSAATPKPAMRARNRSSRIWPGVCTAGPPRVERLMRSCVSWTQRPRAASPPKPDCSSPFRRCWCRRIFCSASSAMPILAIRRSCTKCRRSSSPRASATSYGARCPTTSS